MPGTRLDRLDAAELRQVIQVFGDALAEHRDAINRLNVYPVPDGDTGTNMALTVTSVIDELEQAGDGADLAAVAKAISQGSLMGARGNSGVILSQILRGMVGVLADHPDAGGKVWADALSHAADAAYQAVMKPVEGTILTVVREAAEAARARADAGADLVEVLDGAKSAGADALAHTPDLLPVLADAGVVDAGGAGFVLLLDALLHVADGRPLPDAPSDDAAGPRLRVVEGEGQGHGHGDEVGSLRYEVMYFLEAPDETIGDFRDAWSRLGDSIVVVGGDGIWNCHIHTDDIGASIEAALECGRPRNIRVTDLAEQVEEEQWVREASEAPGDEESPTATVPVRCAVVAVSVGGGLRRILHSLGVQAVVAGGQTMNPSTAQLLAAVEGCPAEEVVILPNNKNIVPVAEQVVTNTDKSVRVVPTRSITEGFAALMAYDPEAPVEENFGAMGDAAEHVTAGEITRAVRDSGCELGPIAEGDWLGISRAGIESVAKSLPDAAIGLLDALVGDDHEIVTLIEGDGSSAADTRAITAWLADAHPDIAVEVHHGGQPLYPYLVGVE